MRDKLSRSPQGTYLRALERSNRLRAKVDTSIYRGTKKEQDHAFRTYFDNENLLENLARMM